MVCYFIGGAIGSAVGSSIYNSHHWAGVCVLGAGIGAAAAPPRCSMRCAGTRWQRRTGVGPAVID